MSANDEFTIIDSKEDELSDLILKAQLRKANAEADKAEADARAAKASAAKAETDAEAAKISLSRAEVDRKRLEYETEVSKTRAKESAIDLESAQKRYKEENTTYSIGGMDLSLNELKHLAPLLLMDRSTRFLH